MKQIKESKLEQMKVADLRELFHNFDDAVDGCELLNTTLAAHTAKWKAAYKKMVWAYSTSLKAEESDEIRAMDYQIANWLTSIKSAAMGAEKSFNTELKAGGQAVMQAFKSFPVKTNTSYITELGDVDSLLLVLQGKEKGNITTIKMLPLLDLLSETVDSMHQLIGDRDADYPNRPNRPQARQEAIDAYLAYTQFINSYRLAVVGDSENEELDRFIELVNSIIARFERTVLRDPNKKPESSGGVEEEVTEETEETEEETTPENPNPENPNPENPNPENPNPENPGNQPENPNPENPNPENPGNQPEEDDPNMPPPGSGGSGFE